MPKLNILQLLMIQKFKYNYLYCRQQLNIQSSCSSRVLKYNTQKKKRLIVWGVEWRILWFSAFDFIYLENKLILFPLIGRCFLLNVVACIKSWILNNESWKLLTVFRSNSTAFYTVIGGFWKSTLQLQIDFLKIVLENSLFKIS